MARDDDELIALLTSLVVSVPPPGCTTLEALVRTRALQQRLTEHALRAAEERWPGFGRLLNILMRQERALLRASEPRA